MYQKCCFVDLPQANVFVHGSCYLCTLHHPHYVQSNSPAYMIHFYQLRSAVSSICMLFYKDTSIVHAFGRSSHLDKTVLYLCHFKASGSYSISVCGFVLLFDFSSVAGKRSYLDRFTVLAEKHMVSTLLNYQFKYISQ